jgi:predicted O-methyltransferase YrrM
MLELAPIAEIVSIEDDEQWFLHWFNQFYGKDKLKLYLLKLDGNYVEAPLAMGKFDLVFVDGKDDYRARCLETAAQVLNAEGVVLVHDAERTYYWPPIREFFAVLETHNAQWGSQTVALELKKHDGVSVSSLEIAGTVKT